MTTDVELTTAVSQHFPSATPRASLDCPAFNVPAAEVPAFLRHLRDAQGYDFLMDATAIDLARGSSIPIYIFSLREKGNIKRALLGEDVGSIVSDEIPAA